MSAAEETREGRRERHLDSLHSYFRLLESSDLDAWILLWAPDCTQVVPYAAGDLPSLVRGRADVQALFRRISDGFTQLTFTLVELHPLLDPDKVFARWHPRCVMPDHSVYTNESVGLFEFDAQGRIERFTEYFNPLGFVDSFDSF